MYAKSVGFLALGVLAGKFICEQFRDEIEPRYGSVLKVDLMGPFEHSGIYIGNGRIIEVNHADCIKTVSFSEFAEGLHIGVTVYCSVDNNTRPVCAPVWADRAKSRLGRTRYCPLMPDNIKGECNCHNFVSSCIKNNFSCNPDWTFSDLEHILRLYGHADWHPCFRKIRDEYFPAQTAAVRNY